MMFKEEQKHMNVLLKVRIYLKPGIPESFNVLLNELQGLGLNIDLD